MEKFSDYKKYFDLDIPDLVHQTLKKDNIQKDIIDYNQKEQLSEGIDSQGKRIETIASQEQNNGYPYSRFTVSERSKKGLQVQNVDLKDTGNFWNSFEIKVSKDETEVLADFKKGADDIRGNFDNSFDFLGLTQNSLENFVWSDFFGQFKELLNAEFRKLQTT